MPLKRPDYAYRHPSRNGVEGRSKRKKPTPADPSLVGGQSMVTRTEPEPPGIYATILKSMAATEDARCRIDITFAVPTHGQLRRFDQMVEGGVPARTAILAIGTQALRAYEKNHVRLDHQALVERFGDSGFEVATRRTVDVPLRDHARRTLDPFGVRSDRDIGRLLGRVVIQHWIESEPNLVS